MTIFPNLETARLHLKVLTLDYLEDVFRHFSDEQITQFMDIEPCKSLKEAEDIITFHLEDKGCRWGIFLKENGEFVGTAGFHYIRQNRNETVAEIGYDLAKSHWGKGYMTEVMHELLQYGFTAMGYDKIDATVEPLNQRSIKLLEILTFRREAELQDGLVYYYLQK